MEANTGYSQGRGERGASDHLGHRHVGQQELTVELIPFEEARRLIWTRFSALEPERVAPLDALGRVLAEDVTAGFNVPDFASSALDGYAGLAADIAKASTEHPVVLPLVGEGQRAGGVAAPPVEGGTLCKIMTGGVIPPGADVVIPWEVTEPRDDGTVAVLEARRAGTAVRPVAEDLSQGAKVAAAGTVVTPVLVGVMASIGLMEVAVVRRPVVATMTTGDELAPPGEPLGFGQIYDSNTALVAALARSVGAEVVASSNAADNPDDTLATMLDLAAKADVLITTGGASVGEHDWVRTVLAEHGSLDMWKVALRPGKPVGVGTMAGTPVFMLPGNPGSVVVTCHAFVQPALRLLGGRNPAPDSVEVECEDGIGGDAGRTWLRPVRLEGTDGQGRPRAAALPTRSSSATAHLLESDGFALVPPGGVKAGESVSVERFFQE